TRRGSKWNQNPSRFFRRGRAIVRPSTGFRGVLGTSTPSGARHQGREAAQIRLCQGLREYLAKALMEKCGMSNTGRAPAERLSSYRRKRFRSGAVRLLTERRVRWSGGRAVAHSWKAYCQNSGTDWVENE